MGDTTTDKDDFSDNNVATHDPTGQTGEEAHGHSVLHEGLVF
jgi:hypothetical protein